MKKVISTVLVTLLLSAHAQEPAKGKEIYNEFTANLDAYFTALTQQRSFNGNVIVMRNKEVLLNKSYSMESGNDSTKVTKDSRFLMASLARTYTKYGILRLAEMGKINLNDKLNKYIPDFPAGDEITIKYLMEQKSGLPRELSINENIEDLPLDKIIEQAKKEKLAFEPGSQAIYSTVGLYILQYIIEKKSEKGYADFIETEIFKKMNLQNTGEYNSTQKNPNFAYGFDLVKGKIKAAPLASIDHYGTGNYYTTIDDLFSFSQQLLSGKPMNRKWARELFWKDSMLVQSAGREGYRAYYYRSLQSRITFIFLANYTDIPFQDITEEVFKILDREPYKIKAKERIRKDQPVDSLKRYVGKYALETDKNQIFTLLLEKDNLYFIDGEEKILLFPEDQFTFFDDPKTRNSYIFIFNPKTNQYELLLIAGDVKFKTVKLE